MKIAVVGCLHGLLDQMYDDIAKSGHHIDLVLCCGDFQSLRDAQDMAAISVPDKYKELG